MHSHLATLPRTVWILGLISLALAVLGPPLAAALPALLAAVLLAPCLGSGRANLSRGAACRWPGKSFCSRLC